MEHNLKGTNLTLTEEIRSYIDKKLGSLDKFIQHKSSARADVELEYRPTEEKTYRAELMLHDRDIIRAEARGATLHEAIDKAAQELFTELTRRNKKKIRTFRHNAARVKEYLRGWRNKL
jgi:ribosomal subunit interface protein